MCKKVAHAATPKNKGEIMKIQDILDFIKEADKLKQIERQSLIHNGGRRENSAEHSWHLAISALVFQKFAPQKLDITKALKIPFHRGFLNFGN